MRANQSNNKDKGTNGLLFSEFMNTEKGWRKRHHIYTGKKWPYLLILLTLIIEESQDKSTKHNRCKFIKKLSNNTPFKLQKIIPARKFGNMSFGFQIPAAPVTLTNKSDSDQIHSEA